MDPYPRSWEADVVLTDGGTVRLRPITPEDADRLQAMHGRLSDDTVYLRFFTMVRKLAARDVERLTHVDHTDRVAIIALLRDEMVAVARYDRVPADAGVSTAEVAIVVEDDQQGRGLGPLMLEHLAAAARERGIEQFLATVLPANQRMLRVFRSAGFEVTRQLADGLVQLTYPIRPTAASVEVSRAREHRAEARSVARLLAPRSVAVLGASRQPGTAGHEALLALLRGGFQGPVYPVNPHAEQVLGIPCWHDVGDIPDVIDLAVVAVPAAQVQEVVEACVVKRVRGLVVLSGGFADAGPEGQERLEKVVRTAREGGLRLVGPNAMGVVNTDPAVSLHATFAPAAPLPGRVGLLTHSGALAASVLDAATRRGLGLSSFVSLGDRGDVSGNDLLQYWQQDPRTDVVLLHLQGFGNPRKFGRIARGLARDKPVVAIKSGRGRNDLAVDALFASAGVIRVDTLVELFETGQALALQPLPAGRRVGIVATSSALAALAVDSCRSLDLEVPVLSGRLQDQLRALGTTQVEGPVDLGPLGPPASFAEALRLVATSGEVDAVLALVTPRTDADELAAGVLAASGHVTLLASHLGHDGVPRGLGDGGPGSVPSYSSPESAARALAHAVTYAAWRARPLGEVVRVEAPGDLDGLAQDGSWVDAERLLAAYGISTWPTARVSSPVDAVAAGERFGWPVALKHPEQQWRDRLDLGGVRLGLAASDVPAAWQDVQELLGPSDLLVQPMAPPGVSTVVRLVQDPAVGPLVSLRLGGVVADLLVDPSVRTLPLTDLDARDLVHGLRGAELLRDTDTAALEELLLRVAQLGEDHPDVAEVLLDPVLVGRKGITVLHAGLRLLPPGEDPESRPRRLAGKADQLLG